MLVAASPGMQRHGPVDHGLPSKDSVCWAMFLPLMTIPWEKFKSLPEYHDIVPIPVVALNDCRYIAVEILPIVGII